MSKKRKKNSKDISKNNSSNSTDIKKNVTAKESNEPVKEKVNDDKVEKNTYTHEEADLSKVHKYTKSFDKSQKENLDKDLMINKNNKDDSDNVNDKEIEEQTKDSDNIKDVKEETKDTDDIKDIKKRTKDTNNVKEIKEENEDTDNTKEIKKENGSNKLTPLEQRIADYKAHKAKRKPISEYRKEWQWPTERIRRDESKESKAAKYILKPIGGLFKKCGKVIAKFTKPKLKLISAKIKRITKPLSDKLQPLRKNIYEGWNSRNVIGVRRLLSDEWYKIRRAFAFIYDFMLHKATKTSLILAFISIMVIESCSRRSFGEAVMFMYQEPGRFLLNYLIVLCPYLLSFMVYRKFVVYLIFTAIWFLIGITDFYMLTFRTTPFTGVDLKITTNEISVVYAYLQAFKFALVVIGIVAVILGVVALFVYGPKTTCRFGRVKSVLIVFCEWIGIYGTIMFAIHTGFLTTKFGNLAISYHEYGLPYCFITTIVDTGISKPNNYSEQIITNLVEEEEAENKTKDIDELPNVIFVQLESFIDPMSINNGVEFSEDPMPFYRSLRENYSSGYLTVPTVVAGTCNTEFEVISGMNLGFFGPGEYPFKTILKETTCESMGYNLTNLGYSAHAIHNNTSGFYSRDEIYANFGFDTFTGIEMMHDYTKVASGKWKKDDVIVGCIMDCLESTKNKDLIYAITVQCHGLYTFDLPEEEHVIDVTGIDNPELLQSYTYYVNNVKQEDDVIKDLIDRLSSYDEDVVVVMYGDHIPGLNLSNEMFADAGKTIYETEYVIWDNMGLDKVDENYTAYEIAAEVFDRIGIHEGTIFKYHQTTDHDTPEYLTNLKNLQYDMLYGNRYVYNGINPFVAKEIKYGVKDITIDKATYDGECLYIEGGYFSKYSKLFINGKRYKNEFISSTLLRLEIDSEDIPDGTILTIKHINQDGKEFYTSPQYVYKNDQYEADTEVYEEEIEENEGIDAGDDE